MYAIAGISFVLFARKCILFFKIKRLYKQLGKLDNNLFNFYSLLFNPYRTPNNPSITLGTQRNTAASISHENLEKFHEIISQKRQNESKE
jgi:uncharacterized protein (UPF0332 family)